MRTQRLGTKTRLCLIHVRPQTLNEFSQSKLTGSNQVLVVVVDEWYGLSVLTRAKRPLCRPFPLTQIRYPLVPSCRYLGCIGALERARGASPGIGKIGESATHQLLLTSSYARVTRTRVRSAYIYPNASMGTLSEYYVCFMSNIVDQAEYCRMCSKVLSNWLGLAGSRGRAVGVGTGLARDWYTDPRYLYTSYLGAWK